MPRLCGNTGQLIFEEVRGLDAHPDFADVIDLVDTPRDITGFLSSLTATFAAVALANPQAPIAFIHSVTAPSALRMLLPYVSEAHARLAARYAWQASAALYAWFATAPPTSPPADAPTVDTAQLVEEAVASGDEHAIKFTEACLREQALNPHPVYLAAASAWVGQLQQAR